MSLVKNIATVAGYARFIHFFLVDAFYPRIYTGVVIISTALLGIGFQVAIFGFIILYARHFSTGEPIQFSGHVFDPRQSIELLVAGSATVVVFLLLSACFIYYSRRTILLVARKYEETCAKRIIRLLTEHGDSLAILSGKDDAYLLRLVRGDARFAGRMLRRILYMVIPTGILAVTVAVLFYLEITLTLLIAVMGSVLMVIQYRISQQVAQHSMRFERLRTSAGVEYRNQMMKAKHLAVPQDGAEFAETLFAKGSVRKQLDAYERRLRSVEISRLASGIFMAVVVGVILFVMGGDIIRDGAGWGRLLIYVVALRFAMMAVQGVFSSITAINRFYPQVRRYMAFVQSFPPRNAALPPPLDRYIIALKKSMEAMPGSLSQIEVGRSDRLALITPLDLNRYTLAALCENLLASDEYALSSAIHSARYASHVHSCPSLPLRRIFSLSDNVEWNDLRNWFPSDDLWAMARRSLPKDLNRNISALQWEQLDAGLKFIVSLISAHASGCAWLFVDAAALKRLGPEVSEFYLEKFYNTIVVVVHRDELSVVGVYGEKFVVVADVDLLIGIGSVGWFGTVSDLLEVRYSHKKSCKSAGCDDIQSDHLDG